jgi:hypothetical protein
VTIPEGGSATFQVKLAAQPAANTTVTVARTTGDADISVSAGTSLTFTTANWNTNQTVTLAAAQDADTINGTATITVASTGQSSKTVTATEAENAAPVGYTWCANENARYTFNSLVDVAYGANGTFVFRSCVTGTITFNNATFGDPITGVLKAGYYRTSVWSQADVGSPGVAGSLSRSGDSWTVIGGGADIWGTADAFRYVSQPLSGDGQIVARVVSQSNSDPWAKAGVMIRETTAAGSRHALMAVTPGNGMAFQRRLDTNGASSHTGGAFVKAPYWVKLTRVGNVFTGYQSADGVTWTTVGSATIAMGTSALIGLEVTSHNNSTTSTAVFDHVTITTANSGNG